MPPRAKHARLQGPHPAAFSSLPVELLARIARALSPASLAAFLGTTQRVRGALGIARGAEGARTAFAVLFRYARLAAALRLLDTPHARAVEAWALARITHIDYRIWTDRGDPECRRFVLDDSERLLKWLPRLENLRVLDLAHSGFPTGLNLLGFQKPLSMLENGYPFPASQLQSVSFSFCNIHRSMLQWLGRCTKLSSIALRRSGFSLESLTECITQHTNLEKFELTPDYTSMLVISANPGSFTELLWALRRCHNLATIIFEKVHTEHLLTLINFLSSWPCLKTLILDGCDLDYGDAKLMSGMLRHLPILERFDLSNNRLSANGVKIIARRLATVSSLKCVSFRGARCSAAVLEKVYAELRTHHPALITF